MKPSVPYANRYIEEKESERTYKIHVHNIHHMKPSINTNRNLDDSLDHIRKKKQSHVRIFNGDNLYSQNTRKKVSKTKTQPVTGSKKRPNEERKIENIQTYGNKNNLKKSSPTSHIHSYHTVSSNPHCKKSPPHTNICTNVYNMETSNKSKAPSKNETINLLPTSPRVEKKSISQINTFELDSNSDSDSDDSELYANAFGIPI